MGRTSKNISKNGVERNTGSTYEKDMNSRAVRRQTKGSHKHIKKKGSSNRISEVEIDHFVTTTNTAQRDKASRVPSTVILPRVE